MHSTVRFLGDDKPWLLLVHGMLTSARHWMLNTDRLGKYFNLVRIDLPGHGRSAAPENPEMITAERVIAHLDAIRAMLGLESWYICGQSFGAGLTLNYARRYPARVRAQVFTNARVVLRPKDDPTEAAARAARLHRLRRDGPAALRSEPFHPRFAKRFPSIVRDLLSEDADRIDLPTYIQFIDRVMPELSLRHIRNSAPVMPTLLINGRHERNFQPTRNELARIWPDLDIVDLDGGHSINIENPQAFDRSLLDFMFKGIPRIEPGRS